MTENKITGSKDPGYEIISVDRLPPPDILKKYEEILPGIAKRIMSMAEEHLKSRIRTERWKVVSRIVLTYSGLIFGFVIGLYGLYEGFYLTLNGYNVLGTILSSSTLVTLVMSFIYGSQSRKNADYRVSDKSNNS